MIREFKSVFICIMSVAVLFFLTVGAYAEDNMQSIISDEEYVDEYSVNETEIQDPEIVDEINLENPETEYLSGQSEIIVDEDTIILLSSDNAASLDDEDDGDDEEEETETSDRDPEAIDQVIVSNVNFKLQAGAKPKYMAEVTEGNVSIWYEGWSDYSGNANYSHKGGYKDGEGRFTTFVQGQLYWYHLCITAEGDDFFTGNTRFLINGMEIMGEFDSSMTICVFDKIFTGQAQCYHDYKTYKTEPTCTQAGREYKKCSYCGNEILIRETPAFGHKYALDEDKTISPTCSTAGVEVYECQNEDCGDTYRKTIPALEHHLVTEIEDPATGEEAGTYTVLCNREDCGYRQKTQSIFPFKKIVMAKSKYGYTGTKITPSFRVVDTLGKTISPNYYTVVYYGNKNIGTATVHVTFSGMYSGKLTKTFKIVKGTQKISAKASVIIVPASDVKKKAVKFNLGAKAKTKLSYKAGSKKISVSSKGIITVKKGTKKGTYSVTITAKGTKNWKKATRKFKIKVK